MALSFNSQTHSFCYISCPGNNSRKSQSYHSLFILKAILFTYKTPKRAWVAPQPSHYLCTLSASRDVNCVCSQGEIWPWGDSVLWDQWGVSILCLMMEKRAFLWAFLLRAKRPELSGMNLTHPRGASSGPAWNVASLIFWSSHTFAHIREKPRAHSPRTSLTARGDAVFEGKKQCCDGR